VPGRVQFLVGTSLVKETPHLLSKLPPGKSAKFKDDHAASYSRIPLVTW
jgi:hypothetical protein